MSHESTATVMSHRLSRSLTPWSMSPWSSCAGVFVLAALLHHDCSNPAATATLLTRVTFRRPASAVASYKDFALLGPLSPSCPRLSPRPLPGPCPCPVRQGCSQTSSPDHLWTSTFTILVIASILSSARPTQEPLFWSRYWHGTWTRSRTFLGSRTAAAKCDRWCAHPCHDPYRK